MQQSLRRVDQDSSIFTAVRASPAGRRRCSSSSSRATSPERASMRALMSMSKSAGLFTVVIGLRKFFNVNDERDDICNIVVALRARAGCIPTVGVGRAVHGRCRPSPGYPRSRTGQSRSHRPLQLRGGQEHSGHGAAAAPGSGSSGLSGGLRGAARLRLLRALRLVLRASSTWTGRPRHRHRRGCSSQSCPLRGPLKGKLVARASERRSKFHFPYSSRSDRFKQGHKNDLFNEMIFCSRRHSCSRTLLPLADSTTLTATPTRRPSDPTETSSTRPKSPRPRPPISPNTLAQLLTSTYQRNQ
ncbi:unnamed protein product [Trichogramma brassicae]|uniref:Uncharacterized protein n=1 Tax=Trichogramma brassicae TaxID=86971 RepID=A0A6H5I4K8_9HYME|nr:unnamed protein product [Trichogramma brassicae]